MMKFEENRVDVLPCSASARCSATNERRRIRLLTLDQFIPSIPVQRSYRLCRQSSYCQLHPIACQSRNQNMETILTVSITVSAAEAIRREMVA